ncbi:MAG: hypothetical protein RLZ37_1337 [Actinomycetota bacterium]|jgi:hypothetical protein
MTAMTTRIDRGSISAFVVCLAMTFIVTAGLAVDSGRLVEARISAGDHAENAARVAVQQVRGIRSGERTVDSVRARRAAVQYLSQFALAGDIRVESKSVTVTVRLVKDMTLLRLVGIARRQVSAERRAELTDR